MACRMCDNAYTNPDLTSDNDLSYVSVGDCADGYRILFRSGDARPTVLEFEGRGQDRCWGLLGWYQSKFCPNCGRRLVENEKKGRS